MSVITMAIRNGPTGIGHLQNLLNPILEMEATDVSQLNESKKKKKQVVIVDYDWT